MYMKPASPLPIHRHIFTSTRKLIYFTLALVTSLLRNAIQLQLYSGSCLKWTLSGPKNIANDLDLKTLFSEDNEGQPGLLNLCLKSVECITLIEHDEENPQDLDMVLQRSEDDSGEFRAWWVNDEGMPSPWHLSKEATRSEGRFSAIRAIVEENAFDESPSVKTVRNGLFDSSERRLLLEYKTRDSRAGDILL
jgi:hypothetical protein